MSGLLFSYLIYEPRVSFLCLTSSEFIFIWNNCFRYITEMLLSTPYMVPHLRYVWSEGMEAKGIANTNETLDYLLPYDSPNKWKKVKESLYNPYTTTGRSSNL